LDSTRDRNDGTRVPKKNFYKIPDGFSDLDETHKDIWITKVYEEFISQVDKNYEVTVRGGGLFGTAYGKKTFDDTLSYLNEINIKRSLKCRPNWCRPCSLYRFKLDQGLIYHVLQISKMNAMNIVSYGSFSWQWSNPEGDFAKSKDSPQSYWNHLAQSQSKPVFYTRIMSEEYAEYLLGSGLKP